MTKAIRFAVGLEEVGTAGGLKVKTKNKVRAQYVPKIVGGLDNLSHPCDYLIVYGG